MDESVPTVLRQMAGLEDVLGEKSKAKSYLEEAKAISRDNHDDGEKKN